MLNTLKCNIGHRRQMSDTIVKGCSEVQLPVAGGGKK